MRFSILAASSGVGILTLVTKSALNHVRTGGLDVSNFQAVFVSTTAAPAASYIESEKVHAAPAFFSTTT